jgi:hypothetical protein
MCQLQESFRTLIYQIRGGLGCVWCVFGPRNILCSHMIFLGHVHNMQRIAPISNGVIDPAGLNNPTAPWYSECFGLVHLVIS